MSYADLRRERPGLPYTASKLIGKLAVLRRRITTQGGEAFVEGDRLLVYATWMGTLRLRDPEDRGRSVSNVPIGAVYFPEYGEEA